MMHNDLTSKGDIIVNKFIITVLFSGTNIFLLASPSFANGPPFTIKNMSNFYLFNNDTDNHPNCPSKIAPGESATTSEYWCGFLTCATESYSADKDKGGCMELANISSSTLTQGGYATWLSISPGVSQCNVPTTNSWECTYDQGSGEFNLNYKTIVQLYSAGTQSGTPVKLPSPATYSSGPLMRGVNLSGMEYDGTFLDAMFQRPDIPDALYFVQQGMNTIRFPIRWEFLLADGDKAGELQESSNPQNSTVNNMYIQSIKDTLNNYLSNGLYVILDLHNYMRFCNAGVEIGQGNEPTFPAAVPPELSKCRVVSQKDFEYIWGLIASNFQDIANKYPEHLIFGLMNEPYSIKGTSGQEIKTADVFNYHVAAIKQIRSKQLNNPIIVSGNYWDPLHHWTSFSPFSGDTDYPPNGDVFTSKAFLNQGIDLTNIYLEVHQYFDSNYSGTNQQCISYSNYDAFKLALGLSDFVTWMQTNKMKVMLTEFGGSTDTECKTALNYMLQFVDENSYTPTKGYGFIGWTAWRGNRHGNTPAFAPFNFLQAENYDVYGGNGEKGTGTGIVGGQGNSLMSSVFSNYLTKPTISKP